MAAIPLKDIHLDGDISYAHCLKWDLALEAVRRPGVNTYGKSLMGTSGSFCQRLNLRLGAASMI